MVLELVTGEKLSGEAMYVGKRNIGGFCLKNLVIVFADAHTFNS